MSQTSQHAGENDHAADHVARGMASEALQLARSTQGHHDQRFATMEKAQQEIKDLINDSDKKLDTNTTALYVKMDMSAASTNKKIDDLATKYDNKFWTLAIVIIVALLGGLVTAVIKR